MGQKLYTDKISQLTHSAGNIILASGAILTIGGQQFVTTSQLSVALPSLVANTLYMVYAVVSGGVPALVISQNVNSVGPAGQSAWKLVGALYSNGNVSVGFGSFVNIDGMPKSELIAGGPINITAHTADPAKGTIVIDRMFWQREGNMIRAYFEYNQSGAGTTGTGNYFFRVPIAIDSSKYTFNPDSFSGVSGQWNANSKLGSGHIGAGNSLGKITAQPYDGNRVRLWAFNATTGGWSAIGGVGSNFFPLSAVDLDIAFDVEYQASGLSNTPIKDL